MSEKTEGIAPAVDPAHIGPQSRSKLLMVSAPPHIHGRESVPRIMLWVFIALMPAAGIAVVQFGLHSLYSMLLSIATAAAAEWVTLFIINKKLSIPDGSAPLTGLLLALSLPPHLPLWIAPAGSFFAIVIVKMSFGGLGRNFLNPAMAGRAFLVAAFPVLFGVAAAPAMTCLPLPGTAPEINNALLNFLTGYECRWLGGASAGALLLGAILLWTLRIIDFALPLSCIGSFFLLLWFTNESTSFFSSTALLTPLFQLLSSGMLFGAIFLATDPVTSPSTSKARILFGSGCGALTFLFYKFGSPNDSIMQAVLLMNCTVPYMERYLIHRAPLRNPPIAKPAHRGIVTETLKNEQGSVPAYADKAPQG